MQKTAADFKGKQVGEAGTVYFMPKKLTTASDLSLDKKYIVNFVVKNQSGEKIGETLTKGCEDSDDPKLLTWMDTRNIALNDLDQDTMLEMIVQSENVGITPGAVVARGQVDMTTFELFTKLNAGGKFQQKRKFELDGPDGEIAMFEVVLKFTPKDKPKAPEPVPEPVAEDEAPQDNDEEKPDEEEEERPDEEEGEENDD